MTTYLLYIVFGLIVGVFSGSMGVGGGSVMIPIMVLLMGLPQVKAHGLSLMVMLFPVAVPAVIGYFRAGKLEPRDIGTAAMIAAGVFCGSYFGSQIAIYLAERKQMLGTVFGIVLVYLAVYTALGSGNVYRSLVLALAVTAVAASVILGARWYDQNKLAASAVPAAQTIETQQQ